MYAVVVFYNYVKYYSLFFYTQRMIFNLISEGSTCVYAQFYILPLELFSATSDNQRGNQLATTMKPSPTPFM